MVKKIRFPLILAEGTEVRTLDELREHFDLEALLEYYKNGKLLTWLEDRYLEGEAEAVRSLDESYSDFQQQFCTIFQVEYNGATVDLEKIERRQERLNRLRSVTDDAEFIQNIDRVAFNQEELADLLDDGEVKIYLCGEKFTVPASRKNITYIGIHNPNVHITGKIPETLEGLEIEFKNCSVDNLPKDKETASRVGDVIPSRSMDFESFRELMKNPKYCPTCHGRFSVVNGKFCCGNPDCKESVEGRMLGFFEALGLDIYGEDFCHVLHEKLKCNNLADLLDLTAVDFRNAGINLTVGATFHDDLVAAIMKRRDYEVLGAMGLPGLGAARARRLLAYIPFQKFASGLEGVGPAALTAGCVMALGKGYGAEKLCDVLITETIKRDLKAVSKYVVHITTEFEDILRVGHSGKDFSSEMWDDLIALGFDGTNGKSFDILIVPTLDHESTKVELARSKNIPIMTEDMFRERYSKELKEAKECYWC